MKFFHLFLPGIPRFNPNTASGGVCTLYDPDFLAGPPQDRAFSTVSCLVSVPGSSRGGTGVRLFTTKVGAEALSFSPKKIRKMIGIGELVAYRIGGEFRSEMRI